MMGATDDIGDVLSTARTIRRFTDEPVDDAVLARCLRAATWAPSGANAQAWRFGWPQGRHGPLRRHAVADVTFLDRWDEPATDLAG